MRESTVRVHDYSTVTIQKGESLCIVKRGINYIVVTNLKKNPQSDKAHCALYKIYGLVEKEKTIINDMDRIVGKLCKKTESSKYFGQPIWEEHCKNGDGALEQNDKKLIEQACDLAIRQVQEFGFTDKEKK